LALPAPARGSSQSAAEQEVRKPRQAGEVVLGADDLASRFQSNPVAKIEPQAPTAAARVYRIVAAGNSGEHYVVAMLPGNAGRLTFSAEARSGTSSNLKLQLFRSHADATKDGIMIATVLILMATSSMCAT
jgi:hypothetical protein